MSKTYCPLPWVGLNILPGEVRPCCIWDGAPVPLDQIRKDMLDGKEISGCQQCYFAEKVGSPSKRLESIEKYGNVTTISTQLLEINFDNVCNLKCRGCCSFSSHMWHSDEKEIYGKSFIDKKYIESDIDDIDISNLKRIDISGGEPLLSKKAELFLGKLVKDRVIDNIELGINTNGTTIPSPIVFEAFKRARGLYINFSIDGIGKLNDYFRSGSNFDDIMKTIEYVNQIANDRRKILINTTVSIYNVNYLKEIKDYFTSRYPDFTIQHRMLQWPEQLAVQNMPDKLKAIVRPIVESFGSDYNDVLEAINLPGKDVYGHFLNYHRILDNMRGENLPNKLLSTYINNNNVVTDSMMFFRGQIRG